MSGQRPFVKSVSRGLSVLARFCLMASLWHAPVPLIHSHDSDIEELSNASAAFVEHLTEYHSGVPVNSHVDFGWHVHFVLLADPVADEPCDEDGRPDRAPAYDPFVACQVVVSPNLALSFEWQSLPCLSVSRVACHTFVAAPPNGSQFLGTYLDSVSLRTLLRVARC